MGVQVIPYKFMPSWQRYELIILAWPSRFKYISINRILISKIFINPNVNLALVEGFVRYQNNTGCLGKTSFLKFFQEFDIVLYS